MAEGREYQAIPDFIFICTPCKDENTRVQASHYCPECQEHLCKKCSRQHGQRKATSHHNLETIKEETERKSLLSTTKCCVHPDRDIEMYCCTHDMVFCVMCIAQEHRSCGAVIEIGILANDSMNQSDINYLIDESRSASECLESDIPEQENNLKSLKNQKQEIQDKLDSAESEMISHIAKLKREKSESLDEKYSQLKGDLEQDISLSLNTIAALKGIGQKLKSVANVDPKQQFIEMKIMKKRIKDAYTLHTRSMFNGPKSIHLCSGGATENLSMPSLSFGDLITVETSRQTFKPKRYKMKSKVEVNVKLRNDKATCTITDICQLPDGNLIVTDQGNKKIKMLDMNYNITDSCTVDAVPTGICCFGKNEVAVKLNNNSIQLISVGSSLTTSNCISIKSGDYYGMVFCDGNFWLSTGKGINIHGRDGTLINTIQRDKYNKAMFKTPTVQHMAVANDIVIVTDHSDGAVCLSKDGTLLRELRDERLKSTDGVCVTSDGTIFLCGYRSNNIVMFSIDGTCFGELFGAECGLKQPISLCYDKHRNVLIVSCNGSNIISVIKLDV